ncbi:MAG: hypothetical protein EBR82_23555 [Caulobacteraceae bacterium]|nr:hypothetical protein [Caulobacteraceae bacterium]
MADTHELVARLRADVSGFIAPIAGAGRAVAALSIALSAFSVGKFLVDEFKKMEKATAKFESVLKSTGGAAGITTAEMVEYSDQLEEVANFSGDVVVNSAAVLATFTNIRGDVFKEAIKSAEDLSAVMGQDLQASVVQIGKALNDPIKGVTALQRVGVSFSSEQKKQIEGLQKSGDLVGAQAVIMAELQKEFGGAAQATADPFVIAYNMLGRVGDLIASVILPSLNEMANEIGYYVIPLVRALEPPFKVAADTLLWLTKSVLKGLRFGVQSTIFAFTNAGRAFQLLVYETELGFRQIVGGIEHTFGTVFPAYFEWVRANWYFLLRDMVAAFERFSVNLTTNAGVAFGEVFDYIATGGFNKINFVFAPLLDGFKAAADELPKIAERVPTKMEKGLQKGIERLRKEIGDSAREIFAEVPEKLDLGPKKIGVGVQPVIDGVSPAVDARAAVSSGGFSAAERGSTEAARIILQAQRANSGDSKKMLDVMREQARIQEEILQAGQELNNLLQVVEI